MMRLKSTTSLPRDPQRITFLQLVRGKQAFTGATSTKRRIYTDLKDDFCQAGKVRVATYSPTFREEALSAIRE
jgi:hypothetical protein